MGRAPKGRLRKLCAKGTVWLAFDPSDGVYWGYWELDPDGPSQQPERFPHTDSLREAIAWARARTERILVRPADAPSTYFWAGATPPPDRFRDLPILALDE